MQGGTDDRGMHDSVSQMEMNCTSLLSGIHQSADQACGGHDQRTPYENCRRGFMTRKCASTYASPELRRKCETCVNLARAGAPLPLERECRIHTTGHPTSAIGVAVVVGVLVIVAAVVLHLQVKKGKRP